MFTQTAALLLDAYRELQARKLFWATLILSALVAGAFGLIGINPQGYVIFGKTYYSIWNSRLIPPPAFYQYLFTYWAIPGWLGLFATVLALLAVAGIFPDLLVGGSVELYLSKPISRLRLFLTKYVFALIFTAAQVLAFCTVAYTIIGLRGGAWDWRIFLAVPLVTLFFSYLYCICVLCGILLRSTLMSILITLLVWAVVFILSWSDAVLTRFTAAADLRTRTCQQIVDSNQKMFDTNNAKPTTQRANLSAFEFQQDVARKNLVDAEIDAANVRWWQHLIWNIESPLPKVRETVNLLSRWVVTPQPFLQVRSRQRQSREAWRKDHNFKPRDDQDLDRYYDTDEAEAATVEDLSGRSLWWVLGTSTGFELVILTWAAWVFCRRDF